MNDEVQDVVQTAKEEIHKAKTAKKVVGITKEAELTVLKESNPKRPGSAAYERFEGYLTDPPPATVQEALNQGLTMGDINYDVIHGFIDVEGAEVQEYEVSSRGPRKPSGTSGVSRDPDLEVSAEDLLETEEPDEDVFGDVPDA